MAKIPETKKIQTGQKKRSVSIAPESLKEAERTVDVIWATDTPVLMRDWEIGLFYEVLSFDPQHVRMQRLNSGAPLLDMHTKGSVKTVLGVVETATLEANRGCATVRFSKRDDVEPIYQDVKDGILKNLSTGYRVYLYEKILSSNAEGLPTYRAIDWEPSEITMATVPADYNAQVRQAEEGMHETLFTNNLNERKMPEEPITPIVATPPPAPIQTITPEQKANIRALAVTEERTRATAIHAATKIAKLDNAFGQKLIDDGKTIDQARALIFDELALKDPNAGSSSQIGVTGKDEKVLTREAMEESILNRADPTSYPAAKLQEKAREFRGLSLVDMGRAVLENNGEKTRGLNKSEIIDRALSTSDYPSLLENVIKKILMKAYQAPPQTWRPLSRQIDASDFKTMTAVQFGGNLKLEKVNQSGEFKSGKLAEAKETWKVDTYGKIVPITRQALINDDLGGFTRLAMFFGQAASNLESDIMWALITGNPVMGDTKTLFHADHKNVAGTGAAPSVASLSAARILLRKQTGLDKEALNLMMKYLIVPVDLETTADQMVSPIYTPVTAETVNVFQKRLEVISEPRLTDTQAWYLATEPGQIDMLVHSYLEGNAGLETQSRYGFDVDGIEVRVRTDFGGAVLDHRGFVKNAGH